MNEIEQLKDIYKVFSFDDIVEYFSEIILFFIKPVTFFENLFLKSKQEKYKQVIFYILLFVIVEFVLTGSAIREIVKHTIIGFSIQCIIDFFPIILSVWITFK